MKYKLNEGVCKFVGDWKSLKSRGFKYYCSTKVAYFYEGINGESQHCATFICKAGGFVRTNHLTGCLYHVFEFIKNEIDGRIPTKLYIDFEKGIISTDNELKDYCTAAYLEDGLDVLYEMYLAGEIIHDPTLKVGERLK